MMTDVIDYDSFGVSSLNAIPLLHYLLLPNASCLMTSNARLGAPFFHQITSP